jgi:hypothetical protein
MTRALRGAFGGNGVYLGELGTHEWQEAGCVPVVVLVRRGEVGRVAVAARPFDLADLLGGGVHQRILRHSGPRRSSVDQHCEGAKLLYAINPGI